VLGVGGIIGAVSGENGKVTQRRTASEPVRGDDRWRRLPEPARGLDLAPRATTLPVLTATF
jgi:hypothetical protein